MRRDRAIGVRRRGGSSSSSRAWLMWLAMWMLREREQRRQRYEWLWQSSTSSVWSRACIYRRRRVEYRTGRDSTNFRDCMDREEQDMVLAPGSS